MALRFMEIDEGWCGTSKGQQDKEHHRITKSRKQVEEVDFEGKGTKDDMEMSQGFGCIWSRWGLTEDDFKARHV